MTKNKALSLRVQWLGERLRKARLQAGYTLEDAGEYLQIRHVTLSRFENGIYRPKPSYVRDLIDFYGISDELERTALLQLNKDAWRKDWRDGESQGFSMPFIDYTWLESRAAHIKAYEPLLVHGLLQTPGYARALIEAGQGETAPSETIAFTLQSRMDRQRKLVDAESPTLQVILEEGALRRRIGSSAVHAEQLRRLIEVNETDYIDVRVLPGESGWHPGLDGPFTLIDMPDPYPDVVYLENLTDSIFLEAEAKVDGYRQAYDGLVRCVLSRDETNDLIGNHIKELE